MPAVQYLNSLGGVGCQRNSEVSGRTELGSHAPLSVILRRVKGVCPYTLNKSKAIESTAAIIISLQALVHMRFDARVYMYGFKGTNKLGVERDSYTSGMAMFDPCNCSLHRHGFSIVS